MKISNLLKIKQSLEIQLPDVTYVEIKIQINLPNPLEEEPMGYRVIPWQFPS